MILKHGSPDARSGSYNSQLGISLGHRKLPSPKYTFHTIDLLLQGYKS